MLLVCSLTKKILDRHRKIVRHGKYQLLKYGLSEHIDLEAENTRYIADNTTIPVPRIFKIEVHENNVKSISMEYIEGRTLEDAWSDMTPSQKISVAQELRQSIVQLRELKPEGEIRHRKKDLETHALEFTTNLQLHTPFQENLFTMTSLVAADTLLQYPLAKRKDNLVFTHGDLAPRNVLVDEQGHVTALLDWEYAGWHPEWWEAARAYKFCNDLPGWREYLSIVLPPDHASDYMTVAFATHCSRLR